MLLSGKNQRERNRKKARRYPGRGFGLSEASEEGYYLHLPQEWLGPVPLVSLFFCLIEKALLYSRQYNSKSMFCYTIFGHYQMPGHFIFLFANFSWFLKQILQQLKPALEMQSAQWFWEQIECFWLTLCLKIYMRKSPVNVHKFLRLREDFMPSNEQ